MLGIDPLRLARRRLPLDRVVQPHIASGNHVALATGTLDHQNGFDDSAPLSSASSAMDLSGQCLAAAELAVGSDQHDGAGVDDAIRSDWAEKPPNTTEWIAPMRAQACIATTPSIDIGR